MHRQRDGDGSRDGGAGAGASDERRHAVRAFELLVSVPVLVWIAYELIRTGGNGLRLDEVLLWVVVVAVVDLLPIPASGGLVVSLSFPILVATSLLYEPAVAGLIALVGSSDIREFRRELSPIKALFGRAQMALAIVVGSAAFHSFATNGIESAWTKASIGAMLATILCYSVNASIVATYTAMDHRLHVWRVVVGMHGTRPAEFLIVYLGLGLYGTLIARFFAHDGGWAVAALIAPLVLARQMFFRSRALELTTEELRDRERALQDLSERLQHQNDRLEEQTALLHVHLDRERETVAELRRVNRMKSEFVAVASHELRTPLTAIIGYANALRRPTVGEDPAIREEFTVGITQQGERLMELVQNLLTASSIESGSISAEVAPVDLADLCLNVVAEFGERRGRIRLEIEPHLPLIQTDRTLLGRVLTNLVDNALKYSDDDAPCHMVVTRADPNARIAVRDEGVGIEAAALPRIFERFYQVDSSATRRFGGTGLGLAIVREIVHRLGGTIAVESAPAMGTTFTVELPIRVGPSDAGEDDGAGDAVATTG